MHPTFNYMGHYLLNPLASRGTACLALNSRYVGNDSLLQMERVIADLGAGINEMRSRDIANIFLIGNSGGASRAAFYQSQAERLTVTEFLDGETTGLSPNDLPQAQGIVLSAAHLGRATIFSERLDPAAVEAVAAHMSRLPPVRQLTLPHTCSGVKRLIPADGDAAWPVIL